MPNRQLTSINTDEPCPLVQGFKWLFSYATGRRLIQLGTGQALTRLKGKVITAFDAGTLAIGVTGTTTKYMPTLDLTTLAVGDILDYSDFLDEQTAPTFVIATATGAPTTGQIDWYTEAVDQFKEETAI